MSKNIRNDVRTGFALLIIFVADQNDGWILVGFVVRRLGPPLGLDVVEAGAIREGEHDHEARRLMRLNTVVVISCVGHNMDTG